MTVTLAGTLFTMIVLTVCLAIRHTFARYGRQVSGLGQELAECREFIEMRMVQRPTTPLRALVSPQPAVREAPLPVSAGLRAAA